MSTRYTREEVQKAVSQSNSYAGVLRYFGTKPAGGSQSHIKRVIQNHGIDTSHFLGQGHSKGKRAVTRKTASQILIVLPDGSPRPKAAQLRRSLLEMGVKPICILCGLGEMWNGSKLVLEIDHIDRNWLDNRISNLRFLCPNCHSQQ